MLGTCKRIRSIYTVVIMPNIHVKLWFMHYENTQYTAVKINMS
jgi:hypothetical protein